MVSEKIPRTNSSSKSQTCGLFFRDDPGIAVQSKKEYAGKPDKHNGRIVVYSCRNLGVGILYDEELKV